MGDLAAMRSNRPATEVENALARKGPRLRFVPFLEERYEAARGASRNRAIAQYLLVYLVVKLLFLLANLTIGSKVFWISMSLRLGIVLPLTVVAVVVLLRPLPSWVHGVAAFTPLTVETALVILLGRLSGAADSTRYVMAACIGIFAQTLLMRAPFRHCVGGLAAALTVFCTLCEIRWPGHFGAPISADFIIFTVGFSLPALYERHSRERAERRDFLLSENSRLHMEEVLRMNSHLERLSSLDALTGVFNRRYLDMALARSRDLAVEKRRWIGILMIDIDHFKSVNDAAGHQHGDFCLEQVAQVLLRSVRAGVDTVARFGGEEFVVILPDSDEAQAIQIGERVRQSIEAAALHGAPGEVLTVSAGATAVQGEAGSKFSTEDLVAAADRALYTAKKLGRNRVIYAGLASHRAEPPLALADDASRFY